MQVSLLFPDNSTDAAECVALPSVGHKFLYEERDQLYVVDEVAWVSVGGQYVPQIRLGHIAFRPMAIAIDCGEDEY